MWWYGNWSHSRKNEFLFKVLIVYLVWHNDIIQHDRIQLWLRLELYWSCYIALVKFPGRERPQLMTSNLYIYMYTYSCTLLQVNYEFKVSTSVNTLQLLINISTTSDIAFVFTVKAFRTCQVLCILLPSSI